MAHRTAGKMKNILKVTGATKEESGEREGMSMSGLIAL